MRVAAIILLVLGFVFPATAQMVTNQPARLKTKVTSYAGKIGSGFKTVSIGMAVNEYPGTSSGSTITTPGEESELHWTFMGRNGNKDVYSFTFTRMTKPGSGGTTTEAKEVQFEGKQVIVFEDELHTVVMETPSARDLKKALSPGTK